MNNSQRNKLLIESLELLKKLFKFPRKKQAQKRTGFLISERSLFLLKHSFLFSCFDSVIPFHHCLTLSCIRFLRLLNILDFCCSLALLYSAPNPPPPPCFSIRWPLLQCGRLLQCVKELTVTIFLVNEALPLSSLLNKHLNWHLLKGA